MCGLCLLVVFRFTQKLNLPDCINEAAMHMQQLRYFASPRHAQTSYFSGGGTLASFRKNTQQLIRPPERCHCSTVSAPPAAHYAYNTLSIVNTAIQIQRLKATEYNLMYLLPVSLSDTKYTTVPRLLKLNVYCLCNKFKMLVPNYAIGRASSVITLSLAELRMLR